MKRLAIVLTLALSLAGCGVALPGSQRAEQIRQQRITNGLLACLVAQRYHVCDRKQAAKLLQEASR